MAVEQILVSWVGGKDLAAGVGGAQQPGPVAQVLANQQFDRIELLYNYSEAQMAGYLEWLKPRTETPLFTVRSALSSPVNFGEIYLAAEAVLSRLVRTNPAAKLNILLSPGTPAMQAVWILLGKTRFPATFWQSSLEEGVQRVEIPFEIAAEYLPIAGSVGSRAISELSTVTAPANAAFADIITQNPQMERLKAQAAILAVREVPVLVYGESGTGKELFARAIHNTSSRSARPFVAVNCGAFPSELIDSILFGHKKGAFTGASADQEGVFQQADGGTLFLDEFGELDPAVQVRLLRVLQDGTFTPVGGRQEVRVDVRIVAATNRDLMQAVTEGIFREDLFYRVAVGVLHLPPLRERQGDLGLLAERVLDGLGHQDAHLKDKKFSVSAKNLILRHPWRGNMRELHSTLLRAALWSATSTIEAEDLREALLQMPERQQGVLDRDVSQGIDIQELCDEVWRHYIPRAMDAAQGKKTRAAALLGLNNYQTLTNLMDKLDLK
ncbi:sigma-54 interaction domain-containing protein [Microbulbifer pacificus]|uniref:Sigma 54-interacting transcriptional regulator n=1 Tax=Microbulbifer pacificus TaxID=407164 RepID=A0AAU0N1J0_9GAMM|nr:sigma 54-interacting transcriptional regulator [Microbulbifer pacificus]WOX05967.1 sigma 54-interacting transcriptional regulator [Microbulbifer pacificus]